MQKGVLYLLQTSVSLSDATIAAVTSPYEWEFEHAKQMAGRRPRSSRVAFGFHSLGA